MRHNPKALGLVLVAALAMSAVAAASASAEAFDFYAEETPVTLKGAQHSGEDVFTTTVGTVKCNEATYTGSQGEPEASALEVAPTYSGCTAFGLSATLDMNGCKYRFTAGTFESGKPKGTLDIICPEGKEIAVTASFLGTLKCTIHIPPQSNLGMITFTNVEGTAPEVTVAVSIEEELKYTHTAGTGSGACSSGSAENGSYTSAALIAGNGGGEASTAIAALVSKPIYVLNPAKVDFNKGGNGSKKPVVIENQTKEKPRIDLIFTTGDFEPKDKCHNVKLEEQTVKGDKCTEEVECKAANAKGFLFIAATEHYTINKAELFNC